MKKTEKTAKKTTPAPAAGAQVNMKVISWIKDHLAATHNDIPIEYVRDWSHRVIFDKTVYAYAIFGYYQRNGLEESGGKLSGELLSSYIGEFEAKLSLRLCQEAEGVQVVGIPMFEVVGPERLAQALRPARGPGKVLPFVR